MVRWTSIANEKSFHINYPDEMGAEVEKERFTCCRDSIFELDYLPIILMSNPQLLISSVCA